MFKTVSDGSMVEQTHLSVSHTKDGKFVINSNGNPQVSIVFHYIAV